jgi:hypothetical protein
MKKIIDILAQEIKKLEKDTELIKQLDVKLAQKLKQNQRQSTLNETKYALKIIKINAATRVTQELFIYSIPDKGKILLDANQTYKFKLIILEHIKLKTMFDLEEGIKPLWNKTNRLTSFNEFTDRTEKLLKKIETKELDEYIGYSASELLYEILGANGELLDKIGIDSTNSYTTTRINHILQLARDNLRIFTEGARVKI